MKRIAAYLALAALATGLPIAGGSAWAQMVTNGQMQMGAPTGQMQMGAATGQIGDYCATPVTTCGLSRAAWVGAGCSCRVPGGRSRGTVASSYYPSAYGSPFAGLGQTLTAPFAAAAAAPLMMGRSVATEQIGNSCATPQKTCTLREPSYLGVGCSCRVPGGRARGTVTP